MENTRNILEYWKHPVDEWEALLEAFKSEGIQTIRLPVAWAIHESRRGCCDFTAKPRTRLEKLFCLAQQKRLELNLQFGFTGGPEMFPEWVGAIPARALCPRYIDGEDAPAAIDELPSIFDEEIIDAYCDFVSAVMTIAHLYRAPDGPISAIDFSLGIFENDLGIINCELYASELEIQYGTIESFNQRYQSSFPSFEAAVKKPGVAYQNERRPWLAAFDYIRIQRKLSESILERLARLADTQWPVGKTKAQQSRVFFDPTGVFHLDHGFFPVLPLGINNPLSLEYYRLWNSYDEELRLGAPASLEELPEQGKGPYLIICGKYLAGDHYKRIEKAVRNGATVIFPFQLPQFDEHLQPFWKGARLDDNTYRVDDVLICRRLLGGGAVWSRAQGSESSPSWEWVHKGHDAISKSLNI